MLTAQFIKIYEGGLYMAWYLPLLVLTISRPNPRGSHRLQRGNRGPQHLARPVPKRWWRKR